MKLDLSGKKILVTGASSGIGRQISFDGNACGSIVLGVARRKILLDQLKSDCKHPDAFVPIELDVLGVDSVRDSIAGIDVINGLVINAGVADFTPAKFINKSKLTKVFDINFDSAVLMISELLKQKKLAPGSSVVLISSISAHLGVPGTGIYAASKAALASYGRVLASELISSRIRVNTVLPGLIMTDLVSTQTSLSDEALKNNSDKKSLGLGKVEDVSNLVMFLLSDLSRWITGSEFVIDGGQYLQL